MKARFVKPTNIRSYFHKTYPDLRLTYGFLALIDVHLESVFKRAGANKNGKSYLDAAAALVACRYPFHVKCSQMNTSDAQNQE